MSRRYLSLWLPEWPIERMRLKARRGGQFDPRIADVFIEDADRILAGPNVGDIWNVALREAPDRTQGLDDDALDALLEALGGEVRDAVI